MRCQSHAGRTTGGDNAPVCPFWSMLAAHRPRETTMSKKPPAVFAALLVLLPSFTASAREAGNPNPKMDVPLEQALAMVDDAKREKLLPRATALAMEDHGIITLYHQVNLWAAPRRGMSHTAHKTGAPALTSSGRSKMQ